MHPIQLDRMNAYFLYCCAFKSIGHGGVVRYGQPDRTEESNKSTWKIQVFLTIEFSVAVEKDIGQ